MGEPAALKSLSILGGLSDTERTRVLALLEERAFEAGDTVVVEGAPGRELYVIVDGSAEVLKRGPDEADTRIAELGPGSCFGEMALIGIMPRSATVRALSPLRALVLPYHQVSRLAHEELATFTILLMNLAREVCRRLRQADAVMGEFGLQDTSTRRG